MNKYIERELALSFPLANGMCDEENANVDFICGCETYKEYLESLPCFEVREWIPVSERPPEVGQYVLVSTDMNYVATATYQGDYWESTFDLDWEEVVAWMPSPKPYKPSLWDKFKDKKYDIDSKYGEQVIDEKTVEQIERECGINKNYGFGSKEEADLWMNSKPVGKEEI